jgi:hypothetical protein
MFRAILSILASIAVTAEWNPYCENIDNRLPCSVPALTTGTAVGVAFGSFIGSQTADSIKEFYSSPDGCPIFEAIYDESPSFRKFIGEYMSAHALAFPTEHAEVMAMAQAANIMSSSVFIQNACSELYMLFGYDAEVSANPVPIMPTPIFAPYLIPDSHSKTKPEAAKLKDPSKKPRHRNHCSDIGLIYSISDASNDGNNIIQGHNEDWWSGVADKMSTVTTPEWWGYLYPGQLPGTSFITTSSGLVLSMNSMYPTVPGYSSVSIPSGKGVSYLFSYVLRKAVSSRTTEEVIRTLSNFPIYSGYSLNVMSACDGSLTNIEGYGDRISVQSRHGNKKGGEDPASQEGTVGHFNAYINSAVEQETGIYHFTCRIYISCV